MPADDRFGLVGGPSGLSGVRGYDWYRVRKRKEQEPIRGINVAVTPNSSPGTICGRMITAEAGGPNGIPIAPNSINVTDLQGNAYVAPTYQANSFSATPQANLQGVLQDVLVSVTVNNVPQDETVARVAWYFRKTGSTIWTPWAETALGGLPNPPQAQALSFGYGQLSNGIAYDFGMAFVSARGDIGQISAFTTNYTPPNSGLAIPSQYMAGGTAYTPNITNASDTVAASANGIAASITIDCTITNQPTDGSLSRISFFYRVSDPNHPGSSGTGPWSFYASLPAVGVGTSNPPASASYSFTYADLTTGVGYDFALACENAQGGETATAFITTITAQAIVIGSPALQSMPNTNPPNCSNISFGTATVNQTTYDQPVTFSVDSVGTTQSAWLHDLELVACVHGTGQWATVNTLAPAKAAGGAGAQYPGAMFSGLSGGTSYDLGVRYVDLAGNRSQVATLGTTNTVNTPVTGSVGPNLVQDSAFAYGSFNSSGIAGSDPYWNFYLIDGASFFIGKGGGVGGGNYCGIRPGDSGKACRGQSEVIQVIAGQYYVLQGYIDATTCSGTNLPYWAVTSTDQSTTYVQANQTIGKNGVVYGTPWQCPAGVTQVTVLFHQNNATINSSILVFSSPQFQLGVQAGPYQMTGAVAAGPPSGTGNNPPPAGGSGGGAGDPGDPGGGDGGGHHKYGVMPYQMRHTHLQTAAADNSYLATGLISGRHFVGGNASDTGAMVDSSSNLLYGRHHVSVRTAFSSAAGSDGSYLNSAQIFDRHISSVKLDTINDGTTYGRPLLSRLSSGKPLIDFAETIHLNKTIDNVGDGSTYARIKATSLTSNDFDFAKGGVNKILDNIGDGTTYARPLASRLSSGKPWIDFSEAIHANKNVDNIGDGTTYARPLASYLKSGRPYVYQGVWSSTKTYNPGDEVVYGPSYWLCITANTNSAPATSNGSWQVIGTYSGYQGAWSSTTAYIAGAEVTYNGNYWVCITANTNSAPTTSNANWQIAGPSSLDNIADGSSRFAVAQVDANKKAIIDFNSAHLNQGSLSKKNQASLTADVTGVLPRGNTDSSLTNAIDSGGIATTSAIDFSRAYTNKHLGNLPDDSTSGRFAHLNYNLKNESGSSTWALLGTWTFNAANGGRSLKIEALVGDGYNSTAQQQAIATIILRSGNGGAVPNIAGATYNVLGGAVGSAPLLGVKVVSHGGSTSATQNAWDVYVELSAYPDGHWMIFPAPGDSFAWSGTTGQADPGAASSTVVVGNGGTTFDYNASISNALSIAGGRALTLGTIHDSLNAVTGGSTSTGLDAVKEGSTYQRVKGSELSGGTVKQLNDGTNVRTAAHVAGAIDTSSRIVGSLYDGTTALTPGNVTSVITTSGTVDVSKPKAGVTLPRSAHDASLTNAIDSSSRVVGSIYDGTTTLTPANFTNAITNAGLVKVANATGTLPRANTHSDFTNTVVSGGGIDFSSALHKNKTLDNIADGATYGALPLANISGIGTAKRALIDLSQAHLNKTANYITYTSGGATVDSLKPAQAGADVTSQNTAADTSKVNGVAAATVQDGSNRAINVIGSDYSILNVEFPGGKLAQDGSLTNVNGAQAKWSFTPINNGSTVHIEGIFQSTTYASPQGFLLGSNASTAYGLYHDGSGYAYLLRLNGGTQTNLGSILNVASDGNPHFLALTVTFNSDGSRTLEATVDSQTSYYVDSSGSSLSFVPNGTLNILTYTGNATGSIRSLKASMGAHHYSTLPSPVKSIVDINGNALATRFAGQTVLQNGGSYAGWELCTQASMPGLHAGISTDGILDSQGCAIVAGDWVWAEWTAINNNSGTFGWGPCFVDGNGYIYLCNFYSGSGQFEYNLGNGWATAATLATNAANAYGKAHTFRLGAQNTPSGIRIVCFVDDIKAVDYTLGVGWAIPLRAGFFYDSPNQVYIKDFKLQTGFLPQLAFSTPLNQQGSVLNMAGTPVYTYSSTTTSITMTIPATTYTYTDNRTTVSVSQFSQTYSGLSASHTYYFDIAYDIASNAYVVSGPSSSQYNSASLLSDCYRDGRVAIYGNYSVTTPASGSGGGSGGGGGGGGASCPAVWQLVETLERGFIRADEVDIGMHLRGPSGMWVRVNDCIRKYAPIWKYMLRAKSGAVESFDVNDKHAVKGLAGEWITVNTLRKGTRIAGGFCVVDSVFLKMDYYIAFDVDGHEFMMGIDQHCVHNATTL